jgi:hypothetical protein
MRTRAYRFGGNTPAFPAQWLYGLYVIVLVTGFLAKGLTNIWGDLLVGQSASTPVGRAYS